MYCYVIFGESNDNHTRCYLYECARDVELGDVVVVSAKNKIKIALVQEVFETIPVELNIEKSKIKRVISKNKDAVDTGLTKSFLLALIDEYKDGILDKDNLCGIMEHFVSTSKVDIENDDVLDYILNNQLPGACLYYIDESGDAEEKELGFWKELKDIEYKLRYGYSFWNKPKSSFHDIKEDPVEYTDEYLKIELELKRLIQREIGEGGYRGFCHKYWRTKKMILKKRFGIEWKSPKDLNPMIIFD